MSEKLEPKGLRSLLDEILSNSSTYKHLDDFVNPSLIALDGVEYYIYIKNTTPTAFPNANPDVIRVQLPRRDVFNPIKDSNVPFVFLGYDVDNDVYATWNPYWAKQRLNVVENVSFYSRFSAQKEARDNMQFQRRQLSNDGEVVIFPREKIAYYLINIQSFFPEMTEYVAIGSKRRTEANEAYRVLTNVKNIPDFARYLTRIGLSNGTINNYCVAIRNLIYNEYFSRNRKIFLAFDSISEYPYVITRFMNVPEIKQINNDWHNTYSAALKKYIDFLIEESGVKPSEDESFIDLPKPQVTDIEETKPEGVEKKNYNEDETDWEAFFTDEQNKLTRIANPELIDKLRPCLNTEYKATAMAFNIIEDFYGDRFRTMEIKDWQNLFDDIDWSNPYYSTSIVSEPLARRKKNILKVTLPDGSEIMEKCVSDTLMKVIKYAGVECVRSLNIVVCGANIIVTADKINPKYRSATKYIGNGSFVNTCSDTPTKYNIIHQISQELDLGLSVDFVSLDAKHTEMMPSNLKVDSTRQKIKVTLPDGRVIQHAKVLQTLIDVIEYAGVDAVRDLHISINKDNLITNKITPIYKMSLKSLGNGLYVHTNSGTQTKYTQIKQISDELHLGLKIELI